MLKNEHSSLSIVVRLQLLILYSILNFLQGQVQLTTKKKTASYGLRKIVSLWASWNRLARILQHIRTHSGNVLGGSLVSLTYKPFTVTYLFSLLFSSIWSHLIHEQTLLQYSYECESSLMGFHFIFVICGGLMYIFFWETSPGQIFVYSQWFSLPEICWEKVAEEFFFVFHLQYNLKSRVLKWILRWYFNC